jgi:orotidine-5'-phosphate decarboxylase
MDSKKLFENIKTKKSFLCVGLDTDHSKLPRCVMDADYPIFEFNKQIIDTTAKYTVAYKPNMAFYEPLGAAGWISLMPNAATLATRRKCTPKLFLKN